MIKVSGILLSTQLKLLTAGTPVVSDVTKRVRDLYAKESSKYCGGYSPWTYKVSCNIKCYPTACKYASQMKNLGLDDLCVALGKDFDENYTDFKVVLNDVRALTQSITQDPKERALLDDCCNRIMRIGASAKGTSKNRMAGTAMNLS